jgi:hypothetical protein
MAYGMLRKDCRPLDALLLLLLLSMVCGRLGDLNCRFGGLPLFYSGRKVDTGTKKQWTAKDCVQPISV